MSTLSELLPAGSGGKQVDFIAHGAINNAQAVGLKSDGKVEPIAATTDPVQNPTTSWATDEQFYVASPTKIGNQVLVFYSDAQNSNYGTVVVGTISGSQINWDVQSTPVVFEAASILNNTNYKMDSVLHESLNLAVCLYIIQSSNAAMMRCFSVSGNTITVGSQHTFNAGGVQEVSMCYGEISGNSRIWINYIDRINSVDYGVADCVTVNNINSISNGSMTSYKSDTTSQPSIAFNKLNNVPILTYRDNASSSYGRAKVISSGISVPLTFGSQQTLVSGNTTQMKIMYDPNFQQTLIIYANNTSGNCAINMVTYVSTSQLTLGTEAVFGDASYVSHMGFNFNASKSIGTAQGMIAFNDADGGNKGKFVLYNSTGTPPYTPTLGTVTEFVNTISTFNEVTWGGDNNYFITNVTAPSGGSWTGDSIGFNFTNSSSFIGIADAAISDTATGSVTIKGGIATNASLPTLTPNTVYYVQNDGTINTTSTGTRIGKALSSTSINLEFNS
jgi:hypothetical protein